MTSNMSVAFGYTNFAGKFICKLNVNLTSEQARYLRDDHANCDVTELDKKSKHLCMRLHRVEAIFDDYTSLIRFKEELHLAKLYSHRDEMEYEIHCAQAAHFHAYAKIDEDEVSFADLVEHQEPIGAPGLDVDEDDLPF